MIDELSSSLEQIISATQANWPMLQYLLLLVWGCYLLTCLLPGLLILGIVPRTLHGLTGLLFAPLLHANFNHVFFNSIPLLVLADFILINYAPLFIPISLAITLISGLGVWLFGQAGLHIGASGLITGYWGFLLYNAYQHSSLTNILLGLICLYYFFGIFLGLFPGQKGVSWVGHVCGLLAGLAVAIGLNYLLLTG